MKMFGNKPPEPTDEDRAAAVRLSALAARLKPQASSDFTEVAPDPLGEPEAAEDLQEPDSQE